MKPANVHLNIVGSPQSSIPSPRNRILHKQSWYKGYNMRTQVQNSGFLPTVKCGSTRNRNKWTGKNIQFKNAVIRDCDCYYRRFFAEVEVMDLLCLIMWTIFNCRGAYNYREVIDLADETNVKHIRNNQHKTNPDDGCNIQFTSVSIFLCTYRFVA